MAERIQQQMKIIEPYTQIYLPQSGKEMLKSIEAAARTCYKSEGKITDESAEKLVRGLISSGHEAMLEHASFTVRFVVDRGVSHELVRHRMASFAQESTRYCNYSKDRFDGEITFIKPCFLDTDSIGYDEWKEAMGDAEYRYFALLNFGCEPQEARAVLPMSVKTEVVMTANLREWRHFFKLRAIRTTGVPHPQMLEVTVPLLEKINSEIPIVFDDIMVDE